MSEIDDMYRKLLESESDHIDTDIYNMRGRRYIQDDDDGEDFFTSKEINPKDDKRDKKLGSPGSGDGIIEEDVCFKRFTTTREHKYTEKELQSMRESCLGTIVHDYSEKDLYHMDDEYRRENDMLNEIAGKLQKVKGTYRKVSEWIIAMRTVIEAWELLEKNGNFIHSEQEFFEMVSDGKIVSNRIIMPKLKRMNTYDLDVLVKYISNPELDPSDLLPVVIDTDDWYNSLDDEEDEEEKMHRLLSEQEVQYILEHQAAPEEYKVKLLKPKMIKGYDKKSYTYVNKKKKKKKGNGDKVEQYKRESLHALLNQIQNDPSNKKSPGYSYGYTMMNAMFDPEKEETNFWDTVKFDGSWADDDAVYLYELIMREEVLKQPLARSKYTTYGDQELQMFFKTLEENGVNTIELRRKMNVASDGGSAAIESKAQKKENKRIESQLIQRITKLNQNPKFKKIVKKAENALNKQFEEY